MTAGTAFAPGQGVPAQLIAGDLWAWRVDSFLEIYPSPDFALSYHLAPATGAAPVVVSVSPDSSGLIATLAAASTASLPPGLWRWALFAVRAADSARTTVCTGTVDLLPDPAGSADTRSHARRMLDAINDKLSGRITKDVEAYTIEGRSLTRTPFEVLTKWRAKLMREVAAEEARASGKSLGPRYRKVGINDAP